MDDLETIGQGDIRPAIEAMLLVSTDPVPAAAVAGALGVPTADALAAIRALSREYEDAGRGFQLREVAGGWRLYTHPAYPGLIAEYVQSWDTPRLTQAALATPAPSCTGRPQRFSRSSG